MIRLAVAEDAPTLGAMARRIAQVPGQLASAPEELRDQDFRDRILSSSDRSRFVVVEVEGVAAGYGILEGHKLAALAHVVFLTLAVNEDFQGRGLGRALMEELLAWARAHGQIEKVELQVRSSNVRAIGLYESLGFVEEGRKSRRLKVGNGEYLDDVYMALWVA